MSRIDAGAQRCKKGGKKEVRYGFSCLNSWRNWFNFQNDVNLTVETLSDTEQSIEILA